MNPAVNTSANISPAVLFGTVPNAMLKAAPKKTVSQVIITPAIATQLLKLVDPLQQRRVNPAVVARYARDMESGNWLPNGSTIVISKTHRLLDGQQRLHACVKSGRSFTALVSREVPDDAYPTIDQGRKRTAADVFKAAGFENPNQLSPAASLMHQYEQGIPVGYGGAKNSTTSAERLSVLERHPGLEDATAKVAKVINRNRMLANRRSILILTYYMASKVNLQLADEFLEQIAVGANLAAGSPALLLRNKLLNQSSLLGTVEVNNLVFKAFNMHLSGATATRLYPTMESPSIQGFKPFGYLKTEQA